MNTRINSEKDVVAAQEREVSDQHPREASFAETALRLGGKSADEAQRTGKLDEADDQVEEMFAHQYQTVASPIHRAIWERKIPEELFHFESAPMKDSINVAMNRAVGLVHKRKQEGRLLDEDGKISEATLQDLATTGYWGLLIPESYGGLGASFQDFSRLITRMATVDPTVAGLASVHGCIGAVDPLRSFGSPAQKSRFLPSLANGDRLSAFALTEPAAGSDLTALRTTAVRQGDYFIVNGEKLFITNATLGRTIGLVCLIDNAPAVLIVDLPDTESDQFRLTRYGLHALKHTHNQGMVFRDFPVPAENLLTTQSGDGLTIAYHGLNLGRVSLCANAAGTMRMMLANMLPWAKYRNTYGESIDKRELVRRRIGTMAGYIVACDALSDWCANLLDLGYRGEMECIIAKIFGSEAQKTAAIDLFMKTHGGRSFLHGHLFGDNVHEFLAPCIYEGEGEMLGMAFFKSLVKHHGKSYFEPIGRILHEADIRNPNLLNPKHVWMLKSAASSYAKWWVGMRLLKQHSLDLSRLRPEFRVVANQAAEFLTSQCFDISGAMRRHQLKLADRQCSMIDLSQRIQDAVVVLCTCFYASRASDEITARAGLIACAQLWRRISQAHPTDGDFRTVTDLGRQICEADWVGLQGIESEQLLMRYES